MVDFPAILPALRSFGALASRRATAMLALSLVLGATVMTSCKPKDPGEKPGHASSSKRKDDRVKVAILADTNAMPLRNYQCALLERLILTRPAMLVDRYSAGGKPAEQAQQIRHAQDSGAKFIVLFPLQESVIAPVLREALAKGVRVISLSGDLPDDTFTASVACDEQRVGAMAADFVLQALKAKAAEEGRPAPVGRVVQLRGDDDSSMASDRALGFIQRLQREPGVVLVHDAPAEWDDKNAAARLQEALRLQQQFDVVYAHNDLMATGADKKLREGGMPLRESMLIMGTDAAPGKEGGAGLVNKGVLDATIFHPPLVDVVWREMEQMLNDPAYTAKKRQKVKPVLITPENAGDFERATLPAAQME